MTPLPKQFRGGHRRRRGFTLLEAAFATMIIGLAVTGLLQLLAAGTSASNEGTEMSSAIHLANNLHEATMPMTLAQVAALTGTDYSPPVNSNFKTTGLGTTWKQHLDVAYLDPANLNGPTMTTPQSSARVTCGVYHNDRLVYSARWVISDVP